MTITMIRPAPFTVPAPAPLRGTLLDAATITEAYASQGTTALFSTLSCITVDHVATFPCPTPDPAPDPKTFESLSWQDGITFAVQTGIICKTVGFDIEVNEAELERVVANKESVAVARALMTQRFADGGTANWDEATDLTPAGGAVDPVVGLAMLEGHASVHYAGAPTLHVPRTIGSLLINKYAAIEYNGDTLVTELGSKVAADGGYESPNLGPDGTEPAAGELWLYASGEVSVAGGKQTLQGGLDLVEDQAGDDSNRYRILWERPYIAAVDCYTAAVRVKVQ